MTERSAAYWLQVAVNERLTNAISTIPISEKTGKNTQPPYIELYDTQIVKSLATKTTEARQYRMVIRVFDESGNSDTVKDTIDDIIAAITGSRLSIGHGFYCYHTTHERSEPSVLLRDKKMWRGTTQFLFNILQTS